MDEELHCRFCDERTHGKYTEKSRCYKRNGLCSRLYKRRFYGKKESLMDIIKWLQEWHKSNCDGY